MTVDEATRSVELWPENELAVSVFRAMGTQWRIAMTGRTGLDYNALPAVLRMYGIHRSEWPDIFQSIRILEDEALITMMEQKSG